MRALMRVCPEELNWEMAVAFYDLPILTRSAAIDQ